MTKLRDLKEAKEKVENETVCLEISKGAEDCSKLIFKVGLGGIVYLGVRSFVGPELDIYAKEITTPLQNIDLFGASLSSLCGLAGGIAYGLIHLSRKENEKDLKKAESELEKLSDNYKFERGHI